jgi:hypothetical protein
LEVRLKITHNDEEYIKPENYYYYYLIYAYFFSMHQVVVTAQTELLLHLLFPLTSANIVIGLCAVKFARK